MEEAIVETKREKVLRYVGEKQEIKQEMIYIRGTVEKNLKEEQNKK